MSQFPAHVGSAGSGRLPGDRDPDEYSIESLSSADADALLAFGEEGASPAELPPVQRRGEVAPPPRIAAQPGQRVTFALLSAFALLALTAMAAAYAVTRRETPAAESAVATTDAAIGVATIDSNPGGAEVIIDGQLRGVTPLRLTMPVGEHAVEVRHGTTSRVVTLSIEPSTLTAQHVELPLQPAIMTGRLEVTSDPSGAQVTVDGAPYGTTPLTVNAVEPGEHRVTISSGPATVTRTVVVQAGATAAVMASVAGAANAAGWLTISAPFELQVLEGGALLGTTRADRLMLPAGTRDLTLVSTPYEFRTTLRVQISPGRTASESVTVPDGSLSVNALPWAEVYVDGRHVGTTPLANLPLPIGPHEVLWRHPDLGERRQTVAVRAETPTRVGTDLTR